jgi:hypothetical protein
MTTGQPDGKHFVFVGGLHRSGTTLLADLLGAHPDISALTNTGEWHDEGQFLQSVYPTASECGGPGRFTFDPRAHWTETDATDPDELARQFYAGWSPYWDTSRKFFVEKSPPDLLRFRFLQAVFPGATTIAIVRHPVAVAYATVQWAKTSIPDLIEHWLHAHELFETDRTKLENLIFVRYEDLVADVPGTLAAIHARLGIEHVVPDIEVRGDTNTRYFKRWRHARILPTNPQVAKNHRRFGTRLERLDYGYDLRDRP